ncbi:uncharacterized protein LOC124946058 [Impatiens glandulifera]|uniref:uncharacterized protein LOC124946058 n=1 Tax=Impatiens glandulifera TaxID=253017 RepID=UPI001FB185C1|nr:uncharacterized protein LOC124946058 [Impatiens glandulifera]
MDANESLTALKKAYADVILNTVKEAAARILVSERKALRYQHELKATKEQGLQMLLRLKQLSASKASEAEVTSLNQQRKIKELESQLQETEDRKRKAEMGSCNQKNKVEELELQLNEAEDIVNDLRQELRQLEAELRSLKKRKLQQQEECGNYIQANDQDTSNVNGICDSQSAIQFNLPPLVSDEHTILSPPTGTPEISFNDVKKSCVNKASVPSIVLKQNDLEPYRNRRTQRIHAFEEKLMAGQLDFQSGERGSMGVVTESDAQVVETSDSENTSNIEEVNIHEPGALNDSLQVSSPNYDVDQKIKPVETLGIDQTIDNRIIKYTFQRKRKKDMQMNPVEMRKCSTITESSSRDSRCVEQVAHQLISLSEK